MVNVKNPPNGGFFIENVNAKTHKMPVFYVLGKIKKYFYFCG